MVIKLLIIFFFPWGDRRQTSDILVCTFWVALLSTYITILIVELGGNVIIPVIPRDPALIPGPDSRQGKIANYADVRY